MKVFDCMSPDSLIMILVVSGVEKNDHRGLLAPFLRKAPLYFGYPLFQVFFHSIKCLCYSKITLFQKTYIWWVDQKRQKSSLGNKKKAKRNDVSR